VSVLRCPVKVGPSFVETEDLMVSALESGSSVPDSSPERDHRVVYFTFTLSFPTQMYKWLSANLMERKPNRPSRREKETPGGKKHNI